MDMLDTASSHSSWAENEFAEATLGDARRTARLVKLATVLANQPTASFPQATDDPAMLKAAYRFFDNDDIRAEAILASHVRATAERIAHVPLVLAVQDTTLLDWTDHPATSGLGPLAKEKHQGLLAHTTLAITPERVPLGLLTQEVWARDSATYACQEVGHKQRSIDEKESKKWLTSLAAVNAVHTSTSRQCPSNTRLVSVGDREADLYDLFIQERAEGVDLLVRAAQDRRVESPDEQQQQQQQQQRLWAALEASRVATSVTLNIPRRNKRPARKATLSLRWRQVTLRPPQRRAAEKLANVTLWGLLVKEVTPPPPPEEEPIEWLLLSTVPILSKEDALERLEWYSCRWGIEVWHKVLKSGCRIEARQLASAARLERCLTLYSVIAWRILYASMLARALPEAPCTALLEEEEWQALYCAIHNRPTPPATVPTLRSAVRWIGKLGGFLGRNSDGEPGVSVLWKGFQRLVDLTNMYLIMRPQVHHRNVGKG
jgi:hypothetical protein